MGYDLELGGWRKSSLTVFLALSNFVTYISFGAGVGGGFQIGKSFHRYTATEVSWICASYPLAQGAFVLIGGRLGAVYGHKRMLIVAACWWVTWSLINAFCNNFVLFNVARAMTGAAGGIIVPNAVAVIGIMCPPGKMRNLSMGIFGAGAPIGGSLGSLVAGLFTVVTPWKWLFIVLAIVGAMIFSTLAILLPQIDTIDDTERMDWIGAGLGISSLAIFNIVWNQVPIVGWDVPYQWALLILSVVLFAAFSVWELRYTKSPIMPTTIWTSPSFLSLVVVALASFMSFGSLLWYIVAWQQTIRHWNVIQFGLGLLPLTVCGALGAVVSSWLIPRLAAQYIIAIGLLAEMIAQVLIATMPAQQIYWAQVFPAVVIMSFSPDFIYTASQIIACNSVSKHQQGMAGSLVGTLQLYGTSIGLGFAGTVERYTSDNGNDTLGGYRHALLFAFCIAAAALVGDLIFVRLPRDTREGWGDENSSEQMSTGREIG